MAAEVPSTVPVDPARPGGPPPRLALYRRYRPATFAEVRGQDHVTEPLRQALRTGRVHHAYLFSGPRGCGKTSSARILARSLNCVTGPTPDPCGKCESCVALAPDGPGSLDVIEIDAASHGGVDDARDLRERAFFAPVSGRFKIYIIDEAHMVTREGFNALLKLVEEPPPHLKFVFATTEPEKVIATIRSRTHHYPFRLVPPAILRQLLEEILAAEQIRYEPAVLPLVVRAGAGSARDSLSVLDQLLAGAGEDGLRYDRTVALLGYTDDTLLDEVVQAFADGDGAAVFRAVNRVVEGGHDPRRFAADLLDRFRDLIVLAAVPAAAQTGLLDIPADRLDRMTEQAGRFGQAELTRAAEIISEGLVQMRGATSPRLLLELMCAQILLPGAGTGEKALLARLERLERRLEDGGLSAADGGGNGPRTAGPSGPGSAMPPGTVPGRTVPGKQGSAESAGAGSAGSAGPGDAGSAGPGGARSAGPEAAGPGAPGEPGEPGGSGGAGGPGAGSGGGPPGTRGAAAARAALASRTQPRPAPESAPGSGPAAPPARPVPGTSLAVSPAPQRPATQPEQAPPRRAPSPAPAGQVPPAGHTSSARQGAPAGQAAPAGQEPPGGRHSGIEVLRQRWPEILEAVKGRRRVAWMLLSSATVHAVEDGALIVVFAGDGQARGFASNGHDQVLATVLQSVLGVTFRIRAVSAGQLAATPGAPRSDHRGPDELSARAPADVQHDYPPPDLEPSGDLSDEARYGSTPVDTGGSGLTGMDLIRRELGGQIIAEIDES